MGRTKLQRERTILVADFDGANIVIGIRTNVRAGRERRCDVRGRHDRIGGRQGAVAPAISMPWLVIVNRRNVAS